MPDKQENGIGRIGFLPQMVIGTLIKTGVPYINIEYKASISRPPVRGTNKVDFIIKNL